MSKYVIRSQGFFYTDEYYAPAKTFRRVGKKTFETKEAAEKAARTFARRWLREFTIGDFVFDDRNAVQAVRAYFAKVWPDIRLPEWLMDVKVPAHATDDEVDALIEAMNVTFVKVYEVASRAKEIHDDEDSEDLMFGPS
jgi:hypothetical protein